VLIETSTRLAAGRRRSGPKERPPLISMPGDDSRSKKRRKTDGEVLVETMPYAKRPGKAYVWGDGSMGQLGLGEDEVEKFRPAPIDIAQNKVREYNAIDRAHGRYSKMRLHRNNTHLSRQALVARTRQEQAGPPERQFTRATATGQQSYLRPFNQRIDPSPGWQRIACTLYQAACWCPC